MLSICTASSEKINLEGEFLATCSQSSKALCVVLDVVLLQLSAV